MDEWDKKWKMELKNLQKKVNKAAEKSEDKDVKRLFDLDDSKYYTIIEMYNNELVDTFCTDNKGLADFVFEKLKKDADDKFKVIYKECTYKKWLFELFGDNPCRENIEKIEKD